MTPPPEDRRARRVSALLAVLFYAWMYGTPLFLLLGLVNRVWPWPEPELAEAYARTTRYFVTGLVLAIGAPVLGIAAAVAARQRRWVIRFGYALGCLVLIGVCLASADSMATGPLFGQTVRPSP